jgi:hypothetical protein
MTDILPLEPEDLEKLVEAHFIMLEEKKEEAERTLSGLERDKAVRKLSARIEKAKDLEKKWKKLEMKREENRRTLSGSKWRAMLSRIAQAKIRIRMEVDEEYAKRRRAAKARNEAKRRAAAAEETALVPVRWLGSARMIVCGPSSSCSQLQDSWCSWFIDTG